MFLQNKYSRWYFSIITKAKSQTRNKKNEYFECHHIIPKCMKGNNKKENLVLLTPKEHFICHILLTKMVEFNSDQWYKLSHALFFFKKELKTTSKIYDKIRKDISLYRRNNYNFELDSERRLKISKKMFELWKLPEFKSNHGFINISKEERSIRGKKGVQVKKEKNKNKPKKKRIYNYKNIQIIKNGTIKIIKHNQLPQYRKYGWNRIGSPVKT